MGKGKARGGWQWLRWREGRESKIGGLTVVVFQGGLGRDRDKGMVESGGDRGGRGGGSPKWSPQSGGWHQK